MSVNASKTAVVTGGSSTFGAAYALGLARRGYSLVLVGRSESRLAAVSRDIQESTGVDVEVLVADLSSPGQLRGLEERLRTDEAVDMLVNSAGAAKYAPSTGFDTDAVDEQVAVNITALTKLTAAVLTGMTRRRRGTVVNISSALAFHILPVSAVYSATKSYVLTFTQALQQELAGSGVVVQAVVPGAMRTEFWEGSGVELTAFPDEAVMSAEDVVDAALVGLDAGEPVTVPSLPDIADWERYEEALGTLASRVSRAVPAERYRR
jgi:short-subunit dehydrogenase